MNWQMIHNVPPSKGSLFVFLSRNKEAQEIFFGVLISEDLVLCGQSIRELKTRPTLTFLKELIKHSKNDKPIWWSPFILP